jgi:hypothetical protein
LAAPGGSWVEARSYGGPVFVWNTANARDGYWGIGVWVRETGSTASYQAYYISTYRILAQCASSGLAASPPSPQARGTMVTLTGSSTGCNNPRYRFWIYTHVRPHWSSFGPYSASNTKVWNTTGYAPGTYKIGVWVRNSNSTHSLDSYTVMTYKIT